MPRFLITDVNTSYNKGDAAIGIGMIKVIQKYFPKSEITLLTPTPIEDRKYYSKYDAKTEMQLLNHVNRKLPQFVYKIVFPLKLLLLMSCAKMNFPKSTKHRKTLDHILNADLIISCSGGRLGKGNFNSILDALLPMYFAKKLGKKVYLCAQSIEPFTNKIVKNLTKFVLNHLDLITVRESNSFDVLKSIDIKTKVFLTADLAFLLDSPPNESGKLLVKECGIPQNNNLRIGITVTDWRVPNKDAKTKRQEFINEITKALEKIIEIHNATIIFFPQVIFAPKEDDRILSLKIKNNIKNSLSSHVFVLTQNFEPSQLKSMMGTMDLFIGKRLHSCIFALSKCVPTLLLGYEKKAWGIMKMLDHEKYVLDINNIKAEKLTSMVNDLLKNKSSIINRLENKIPLIQQESFRNGEFIEPLLAGKKII